MRRCKAYSICAVIAVVWRRVARFGLRTGKHPQEQDRAKFGEFARKFVAIKTPIRWVDFEAGERVGAVYGPRLGSQRTATPPAFIMLYFAEFLPF